MNDTAHTTISQHVAAVRYKVTNASLVAQCSPVELVPTVVA